MIQKKDFFRKYNILEKDFKKTGLKWSELEDIFKDYEKRKDEFEPTAKYIAEVLLKIKKVHSVRYRIKNSEHLIEKIIRKKIEDNKRKITLENYISEIDDIIGVRALHLFKDDWEEIDNHIISTWELKEEKPTVNIRSGDSEDMIKIYKNKNYKIKEHKYGYRSVHYIIKSSPTKKSFTAEIQVRTIFEEGWSEIDHFIRYPYDQDNPILKQYLLMFNRLAGSADEMGSYIKFLQNELSNREKILKERNDKIKELKEKINQLEIDKSLKVELGSNLDELSKDNYLTISGSNPTIYNPIINSDDILVGSSIPQERICSICGKPFIPSGLLLQTECEECRKSKNIFYNK